MLHVRIVALGLFVNALAYALPFFVVLSRLPVTEAFFTLYPVILFGLVVLGLVCSLSGFGRKGLVEWDSAERLMSASFLLGGISFVTFLVAAPFRAEDARTEILSPWFWLWLGSPLTPAIAFLRSLNYTRKLGSNPRS